MKSVLRKIFFFLAISQVISVNILFLNDVLSPSHHLWNKVLASKLASKGHNVTFVSVNEKKGKIDNLHELVIEGVFEAFYKDEKYDLLEEARFNVESKIKSAAMVVTFVLKGCRAILSGKNGLDGLLNYPNDFKFDIVVNDFTAGPCLLPLVHKFNYPPVVGVSAFNNPSYTTNSIGGHKYPAYVPFYIMDFPQVMTFYQRFYNHILYWIEKL